MNKLKFYLNKAKNSDFALGAFNIQNLETLQAVVDASIKCNSPAIISVSESALKYTDKYIIALVKTAKEKNPDLFLHLDHGKSFEICKYAVDLGFDSVMIDGSALPFEDNITLTKHVVTYAHSRGVLVEGELGKISGKEDTLNVKAKLYTNPLDAKKFVEETQVDSLAISIGTRHGIYKNSLSEGLRLDILQEIEKENPDIPLVLHGASCINQELIDSFINAGGQTDKAGGTDIESLKKAIQCHHIAKVNTDTDLRLAFTLGVREAFNDKKVIDPRVYLGSGREYACKIVIDKMQNLLQSINKREG